MKILVTGTRGIPDIVGGVETHCEELYPRLVKMGHDVIVARRTPYVKDSFVDYQGVKLKNIFAPKTKSLEAIVHTFLAVLYAKKIKADIIHIHAVGPALVIPLAKLLGLRVVFTHHGPDYDRQKWSGLAKWILRRGESFAVRFSDRIVVISGVIKGILWEKYSYEKSTLIPNGVNLPQKSKTTTYLEELGLKPNQYIFTLGRFVKEKGFDLLIEAFLRTSSEDVILVIAGDADHEDDYSIALKNMGGGKVLFPGFVKGEKLNQLFANARLFVLPSFHEGLPISLLEAMSYNLDVLVSDIPANKEVGLDESFYFNTGDCVDLCEKLEMKLLNIPSNPPYDLAKYNWDNIAQATSDLYLSLR